MRGGDYLPDEREPEPVALGGVGVVTLIELVEYPVDIGFGNGEPVILDGVPRTIAQAEAIEKMGIQIDKAVELSVADEVIVERMGGRRVCEKCGASYHIINKKSKVEGVCDCCGGKLVTRKDDEPATVLDRLKAYHEQTEPLVAFYKERNKLAVIPFSPSIEATTAEVMKALEA